MNVLAIARKEMFSPNHVGNDAAILQAVCQHLSLGGAKVEILSEEGFMQRENVVQDFIVNMGRMPMLIERLKALQSNGRIVVNSAFGVEKCFRASMTRLLLQNGIGYPKSHIVDTDKIVVREFSELGRNGVWIKRGDFHAIHKEDVSFAASAEQAQSILMEYALRGIKDAVISEHLPGDLVKFYAVRGGGFFYWFYPNEYGHHKFEEYQLVNGETQRYSFEQKKLFDLAESAARVLDVHIYGGDAIIGAGGDIKIIDLNDWPSFAPCRQRASSAISNLLFNYHTVLNGK